MSSSLDVVYMSAQGNRFMVVTGDDLSNPLTESEIRAWSCSEKRAGFDQLLLIRAHANANTFLVDIFNADGSTAKQCGNGMRALALFIQRHYGRSDVSDVVLKTPAGDVRVREMRPSEPNAAWVRVCLPGPSVIARLKPPDQCPALDGVKVVIGNPHWVLFWPHKPTPADCDQWGRLAQQHPEWRDGVNVGLVHGNNSELFLRVYERGVGPTMACGSGACAAVIATHHQLNSNGQTRVSQPGGAHVVNWSRDLADDDLIELTGDVHYLGTDSVLRMS